jgi:hypothetical protein
MLGCTGVWSHKKHRTQFENVTLTLSVVMQSVVMMSVAAPLVQYIGFFYVQLFSHFQTGIQWLLLCLFQIASLT